MWPWLHPIEWDVHINSAMSTPMSGKCPSRLLYQLVAINAALPASIIKVTLVDVFHS